MSSTRTQAERDRLIAGAVEQVRRDKIALASGDHLDPDREFYVERIERYTEWVMELKLEGVSGPER